MLLQFTQWSEYFYSVCKDKPFLVNFQIILQEFLVPNSTRTSSTNGKADDKPPVKERTVPLITKDAIQTLK